MIADCTGFPTNKVRVMNDREVVETFIDGVHPVEVRIIRTLKGDKPAGKQTIATIYDMTPGRRYLLYSLGGDACGTDFLAIPELSVVEMAPRFDLNSLENKPLADQVFLIFKDRLSRVKVLLGELEREKWALQMAVPD